MQQDIFIDALDVVSPRGNQAFGQPGEHAAAQLMPWPSVMAGAVRSAVLTYNGYSSASAIKQLVSDQGALAQQLSLPGANTMEQSFRLGYFGLAQRSGGSVKQLVPLPADVVVTGTIRQPVIQRLLPQVLPDGVTTSSESAQLPVLRADTASKALSGLWLNASGWQQYCTGEVLNAGHLVATHELVARRHSVGIGMDSSLRRVNEGQLYTAERLELKNNTGYWARLHYMPEALPDSTLLRFGGDGHAARVTHAQVTLPALTPKQIKQHKRFAIVLWSPALFGSGGVPDGIDDTGRWQHESFNAQLVCSVLSRPQVISGWDLAKQRPKPARAFVPAGSVYWFDQFEGDAEALIAFANNGLWHNDTAADEQRLVEGFNRFQLVAWSGNRNKGN
jgi:CRISPR-associated protein Cmr3